MCNKIMDIVSKIPVSAYIVLSIVVFSAIKIIGPSSSVIMLISVSLLVFSFYIFSRERFRKVYSFHSLKASPNTRSRHAFMFSDSEHKLDGSNLYSGDWSIALKPEEFAIKHKFWNKDENKIEHKILKDILISQIGRPLEFDTNNSFPLHHKLSCDERRLFALFALRLQAAAVEGPARLSYINQTESLINKLFEAYKENSFHDVDEDVCEIIDSYGKSKTILDIAEQHHYVSTFFAGLLEECRTSGPLPSADFLWVKKCNRTLWYLLNNIGRRVGWAECAGAFSHYLAEKEQGKVIREPEITTAIDGFVNYLSKNNYGEVKC